MFLHADSEDSDQTGRMPRLIRVFARRKVILLVLSCCDSFHGHVQCGEKGNVFIIFIKLELMSSSIKTNIFIVVLIN